MSEQKNVALTSKDGQNKEKSSEGGGLELETSSDKVLNKINSPKGVISYEDLERNLDLDENKITSELEEINVHEIKASFEPVCGEIQEGLEESIEEAIRSGSLHQFENLKERVDRIKEKIDSGSIEELSVVKEEVSYLKDNMEMLSEYIVDSEHQTNSQQESEENLSQDIEELKTEVEEIRSDIVSLSEFMFEM